MKTSLFVSAIAVAIASGTLAASAIAADAKVQPNIIVILADDLGWGELGAQGNREIPTPNIDSIAAGGVRFTQGYVSGPYCSPTRAGLLTGRYQTRFGHEWNPPRTPDSGLPLDQTTIADRLKAAGYATGIVGKWHLGFESKFRPSERGFDEFYGTLANTPFLHPQLVDTRVSNEPQRVEDEDYYTTDAYGKRAVEFINEHKQKPFFLYLPFNAQHAPLQARQEDLDRFPDIAAPKRKKFAAMLASHDDAVGEVLEAVKANKLEENTLIVYFTDNGGPTQQTTSSNLPLRGFKATTCEGGVRVPFFVQWKGHIPAGKVYEQPIIQLDILPTALAAAGVKVEEADKLDGVDLLPYVTAKVTTAPHDSLYWRFGQQWAIRQGNWKLVASRLDGPEAKLFNLKDDISESQDLSSAEPDKVAALRTAWEKWDAENIDAKWLPSQNKPKKKAGGAAGKPKRPKPAAAAE